MRRPLLITLLAVLIPVLFSNPAQAASVGINPPAAPVTVAMAELKLTVTFDTATVTPPGTVKLTFIVTNTGASTASNVAIDNLLPIEFSYVNGVPAELKNLGALASGDTITKQYDVTIPDGVATNRYVDEAIASAANSDSVESIAAINVNNGRVLGASDSAGGTLAATGTSSLAIIALGCLLIGLGSRKISGLLV